MQILNLSPSVPKLWGNCFRGSRQTLLRTEINLGPLFDHIPANLDLFTDLIDILHEYPGEFVIIELDVTPFLTRLQDQDKSNFLIDNYQQLVVSYLTNVQLVLMHIHKTSTPRIIILGQSLIMDSAVPSDTLYVITNNINGTLRNLCTAMEILYVLPSGVTYPIADGIATTSLIPSNSIDAAMHRKQLLLEAIHTSVIFLKKIRKPPSTTGLAAKR